MGKTSISFRETKVLRQFWFGLETELIIPLWNFKIMIFDSILFFNVRNSSYLKKSVSYFNHGGGALTCFSTPLDKNAAFLSLQFPLCFLLLDISRVSHSSVFIKVFNRTRPRNPGLISNILIVILLSKLLELFYKFDAERLCGRWIGLRCIALQNPPLRLVSSLFEGNLAQSRFGWIVWCLNPI